MGSVDQWKGAEQLESGNWAERHAEGRRQIDGDRRSWKVRRVNMGEDYSDGERRQGTEKRVILFRRKKTDRRKSPFA